MLEALHHVVLPWAMPETRETPPSPTSPQGWLVKDTGARWWHSLLTKMTETSSISHVRVPPIPRREKT